MIQWVKDKWGLILFALGAFLSFWIKSLMDKNKRLEDQAKRSEDLKEIEHAKEELKRISTDASDAESEYERVRDQYRKDDVQ